MPSPSIGIPRPAILFRYEIERERPSWGVTIVFAQPYAIYMSSLLCRFAGYYGLRQIDGSRNCITNYLDRS